MATTKGTARQRRGSASRTTQRILAEHELAGSPGMLGLFGRAAVGALPVGRIPFASALPGVGGRRAADVPDDALVLSGVRTDLDRLAAYARVTGFTLRRTLPVTYPHMLAFPLHLSLMTDPRFPFGAIGLVHIDNRIVQHRPIGTDEALALTVWAEPLLDHPKGRQVRVRTEARVAPTGELVWEETSTNLHRGSPHDDATAVSVPGTADLAATATWRLPGDLGRRYAGVSGDYNPIHVHPLTARLFGFPSAIAHGMWTKARCLAAMESELPDAYAVEVQFKRPVVLPATVAFAEARTTPDGPIAFGVRGVRKDTPHLDGLVTPAASSRP